MNRIGLVLLVLCAGAAAQSTAGLDPLVEFRYAGPPKRDADGRIARRADVLAAYRRVHPCPSTGRFKGACPGWALDHVIPLACGGADAVWNLMWMRNDVKALVDRYERKISAAMPPIEDTGACANVIQ